MTGSLRIQSLRPQHEADSHASDARLSDSLLFDRFLQHDEQAFAAIVRRHGNMVWSVCRRILACHQDSEDAFQATFLLLVQKARSITKRQSLASWLYKVARHTALKAKIRSGRRRAKEKTVSNVPEPDAKVDPLWHELEPLLDEELSRIPEKYRAAIILCDLEGMTRKEAALELGWPEGTVAGRLARAVDAC